MNGQFNIGINPTPYFFSVAIVLGVLFAMIKDDDGSLLLALVQWQLQVLIPISLLIISHTGLNRVIRATVNPWLMLSVSGLIGATLFIPFALFLDLCFGSEAFAAFDGAIRFDDIAYLTQALGQEWLGAAPPVIVSWVALNAPWILGYRIEKPIDGALNVPPVNACLPYEKKSLEHSQGQAAFLSLLPAEKRGKIYYLKAELHYVQVVTDKGSTLILYNLRDAIQELPVSLGLCVHRSYWVALNAVDVFIRHGRQGELKMLNGECVPVSRSKLTLVAKAVSHA